MNVIRLSFLSFCVMVFSCSVIADMTFEELLLQEQIRITTGDFQAVLGDASYGYSVNNLRHVSKGTDFGKSPDAGQSSFLWKLELTDDEGVSSFVTLTNLSACDKSHSFDSANGLVLNFDNLDVSGEADVIDVTVTIKEADIDNMTAWRIDVDNRSVNYSIWKIRFPVIAFGDIDGDGPDSVLANPAAEGRYMTNLTQSGWSGWAEPHGLRYPGGRGQMQWSAYFKGFATNYYPTEDMGPGVYLATHDQYPVAVKNFSYTSDPNENRWIYNCTLYPEDIDSGIDYNMSYDHIIGVYDGGWYEAADIYREWADSQHWVRKGKLLDRTDVPQWFKDITYCHRIDSETYTAAEAYYRSVDLNSRLTGPMVAQWYHWHTNSGNYAGEFPPSADAIPSFGAVVGYMLNEQIYATPYVNNYLWDMTRPDWSTAEPYAVREPDGSVKTYSENVAVMNVASSFWRNHVSGVIQEIVQNYGVKGFYIDQAGGVIAANYSDSFGEPTGWNEGQVGYERQHLEEMIAAAHSVDPNVMFWGEGVSEFAMDLLHGKLVHYNLYQNYLPLFPAVYHEYIPGYARLQKLIEDFSGDAEPEAQAGWIWMMGYQIGRIWSTSSYYGNADQQEMLTYIDKLNSLRSEASEYLAFGRMMKPPYIDPCSIPELSINLTTGGTAELPGILASIWRNAQGKLAMAVTNITDTAQNFHVKIDLDEYDFKSSNVYSLYEYGNQQNVIISTSQRIVEFDITLDSLDAGVFEFSGLACENLEVEDLNKDCYIDFSDFAILAENWLECTNPSDINCSQN